MSAAGNDGGFALFLQRAVYLFAVVFVAQHGDIVPRPQPGVPFRNQLLLAPPDGNDEAPCRPGYVADPFAAGRRAQVHPAR